MMQLIFVIYMFVCRLSNSALNNEFFAKACHEWRERLAEGKTDRCYEPRCEKTSLRGFRPGQTQPGCTAKEDG